MLTIIADEYWFSNDSWFNFWYGNFWVLKLQSLDASNGTGGISKVAHLDRVPRITTCLTNIYAVMSPKITTYHT